VVAEIDRVGERLETERVIRQPGDRQRARDRAERERKLVLSLVEGNAASLH
jgi:hypothetical protein